MTYFYTNERSEVACCYHQSFLGPQVVEQGPIVEDECAQAFFFLHDSAAVARGVHALSDCCKWPMFEPL